MQLPLRQDLTEVLDAEHLSEDRIGEDTRASRPCCRSAALRARHGSAADMQGQDRAKPGCRRGRASTVAIPRPAMPGTP